MASKEVVQSTPPIIENLIQNMFSDSNSSFLRQNYRNTLKNIFDVISEAVNKFDKEQTKRSR